MSLDVRTFFILVLISLFCRIASIAETFVALFDGTTAEIRTVKSAITTAITRDNPDTLNLNGIGYPIKFSNLFP